MTAGYRNHRHAGLRLLPALCLICAGLFCAYAGRRAPLREALERAETLAAAGDTAALFSLASLYELGYDSVASDTARSMALYRRAAALGSARAANYLGYVFYRGGLAPRDIDSALFWLSRAARLGDAKAANNLGYLFLEGEGVEHSDSLAALWLAEAAEAGLPTALTQLADLYAAGRGVERDSLRAEMMYMQALKAGFADAEPKLWALSGQQWLSAPDSLRLSRALELYPLGSGRAAVALLLTMTEETPYRPHAKALLADALAKGRGIAYDYTRSLALFHQAAREGYAPAQFIIAETLETSPDALNVINTKENNDHNDHNDTPHHWYDQARQQGISSAREAYRRLFSTLP